MSYSSIRHTFSFSSVLLEVDVAWKCLGFVVVPPGSAWVFVVVVVGKVLVVQQRCQLNIAKLAFAHTVLVCVACAYPMSMKIVLPSKALFNPVRTGPCNVASRKPQALKVGLSLSCGSLPLQQRHSTPFDSFEWECSRSHTPTHLSLSLSLFASQGWTHSSPKPSSMLQHQLRTGRCPPTIGGLTCSTNNSAGSCTRTPPLFQPPPATLCCNTHRSGEASR